MNYFVPSELKKYDNWVVWKKENNRKIPYNPITGQYADPTKSCCSYDDAFAYYNWTDKYNGVGFVFTPECNLTFIDLDDCIDEEGELSPFARELVDTFHNSYIEYSQSEKGLHIICKGTVPTSIKKKEIEIYSSKRYVAFTGNSFVAVEPSDCQDKLNELYERFSSSVCTHTEEYEYANHSLPSSLSSAQLYCVISHSKQADKWIRIFNADISGYSSASEAVMAFVAITNYFANGDVALIHQLFFSSSIPERFKKYKNPYYLDLAIKKAQQSAAPVSSHLTDDEKFEMRKQYISDYSTKRKRRF